MSCISVWVMTGWTMVLCQPTVCWDMMKQVCHVQMFHDMWHLFAAKNQRAAAHHLSMFECHVQDLPQTSRKSRRINRSLVFLTPPWLWDRCVSLVAGCFHLKPTGSVSRVPRVGLPPDSSNLPWINEQIKQIQLWPRQAKFRLKWLKYIILGQDA